MENIDDPLYWAIFASYVQTLVVDRCPVKKRKYFNFRFRLWLIVVVNDDANEFRLSFSSKEREVEVAKLYFRNLVTYMCSKNFVNRIHFF